jgi:Protein of unknown function (DUF3037)
MTAYQFAIVRYQHSTSAGELVNVGIVMWLPNEGKIWYRLNERYGRLSQFFSQFDGSRYREMLRRIDRHFAAVSASERQLTLFSERFGHLTDFLSRLLRRDDSCFQWSDVMAGMSDEPLARLEELFAEFVTKHEDALGRTSHDDEHIRRVLDETLRRTGLATKVRKNVTIQGPLYSYDFMAGWRNGTAQVIEPISFDLVHRRSIMDKANTWSGRLHSLQNGRKFQLTGVFAEPADPQLRDAFSRALKILDSAPSVRTLIPETEIERAAHLIESDIKHD